MRRSVGMMMTECYDLLFTPFFCIASALESCICMGHWAVRYIALQSWEYVHGHGYDCCNQSRKITWMHEIPLMSCLYVHQLSCLSYNALLVDALRGRDCDAMVPGQAAVIFVAIP